MIENAYSTNSVPSEYQIFDASITEEERDNNQKPMLYEGAPQTIYESSLIINNPRIEQGYKILTDFNENSKTKDKENFLNKTTRELWNDFENIEQYIDYWQQVIQIAQYEEDKQTGSKVGKLQNSLANHIKRQKIEIKEEELEDQKPSRIDTVLNGITHSNNPEIYEALLHGILNSASDVESNIDLIYKIVESAIRSNDDQIVGKTMKILTYNTQYLTSESKNARYLIEAIYSTEDKILKKALSIESLRGTLKEKYLDPTEIVKYIDQGEALLKWAGENIDTGSKDPKKWMQLQEFYSRRTPEGTLSFISDEVEGKFPYDLLMNNPNSVMQYSQRMLAKINNRILWTPFGRASASQGPEFDQTSLEDLRCDLIEHNKNNQPNESKLVNDQELSTIISYIREDIDTQKIMDLRKLRSNSIENLKTSIKRQLSPRGNEILITDEKLKSYGFTKLLFRKGSQVKGLEDTDIAVRIYMGNILLDLTLDQNKNLIHPISRKPLDKEPVDADNRGEIQIHTWVLAHLEELLCKEKEQFTDKNLGGQNRSTIEGLFQRSAHLRQLKSRSSVPSHRQVQLALTENPENPIDLLNINKKRKERGLKPVTYVSSSEVHRKEKQKPVQIYSDNALDKFRELI